MGYLLSPLTWQFFGDFWSFVLHVILVLFGSFGSRIIICALRWGIYCPLQLGWGIYCPLQLAPPTWHFLGDFQKFCFARNFLCPLFQGIYCPLQLDPLTWQFLAIFGSLILCVIICALRFCGVTGFLHAALAACVCCSILSISRMMCGIRNSLRMFWWCVAGWCFVQ